MKLHAVKKPEIPVIKLPGPELTHPWSKLKTPIFDIKAITFIGGNPAGEYVNE